jgi:hypothetical protein
VGRDYLAPYNLEVEMSFYGSSFIFNGTSSEIFDLRIFEFEPSNPADSPTGGDSSIYEQWLYRRDVPYFYGRYYEAPFEFDFTVGSFSPIDGATRNAIQSWLLGRPTYLPLQIVQDDLSDITFNVIITQTIGKYVGNLNYAMSLHARCDRPWAIYSPPTLIKSYSGSGVVSETFNYLNASAYGGYNRPQVTFTMNTAGSPTNYFSLINQTEDSRETRFEHLTPLEKITLENDKGIIVSSASALRMENFTTKNFVRLLNGVNTLTISGNISEFTLGTTFARIVGG